MTDVWYPPAKRDPIVVNGVTLDGGTYTGGPAKGLLHTTEGKTYAGARAAYVANRTPPQWTASFERGLFEVWQHIPSDRAGRALVNNSGGVQTNRDGVRQIEVVSTCDPVNRGKPGWLHVADWPQALIDGLAGLMRWIELTCGVQRTAPMFKAYPASYGANNGVRFTPAVWDAWGGWCGHQHVPDGNLHGDPGNIPIIKLLESQGPPGAPTPPQITPISTIGDDVPRHQDYFNVPAPSTDAEGDGAYTLPWDFGKVGAVYFNEGDQNKPCPDVTSVVNDGGLARAVWKRGAPNMGAQTLIVEHWS